MKIIQLAIVLIVGFLLIYMDITPNGLLIGLISFGAAWLLTIPPLLLFDRLTRKCRSRVTAYDETVD